MVSIANWFLTLHPHCISVDLEAEAEALIWFCRQGFSNLSRVQRLVSSSSWLHCTIKGSGVLWLGFWRQEYVTEVCACLLPDHVGPYQPSPQEMTGRWLWSPSRVFHYCSYLWRHKATDPPPLLHCWYCSLTLRCSPLRALPPNVC